MSARTQPTPVAFHAGTAGSLGTTSLVGIRREQAVVSVELASTGGTAFVRALLGAGGGQASDTQYYTKLGRAELQIMRFFGTNLR